MNVSRVAALVRKEILETLRAGWANIPITAALSVLLLNAAAHRQPLLEARLSILLPLLAMPVFASTVLTRMIQTERLRGALLPLLVYGGSAAEVWLAKVIGASSLAYVVMLLSLGGYVGAGAWAGRDLMPRGPALVHLFLTMPLAAVALIALQALLFWLMPKSTLLSSLIPIAIMFGGAQAVALLGLHPIDGARGAAAALTAVVVVTALAALVARFPRERAAGV